MVGTPGLELFQVPQEHRDCASEGRDQVVTFARERFGNTVAQPMKGSRDEHSRCINGDIEIEHR